MVNSFTLDFEQAKVKHLYFKSLLRSILYGAQVVDEKPVLSYMECAVGKWIYGHALSSYGHIAEVHDLEKVHKTIHVVANQLIDLYKNNHVEEAQKGLGEMEAIADQLIGLLTTIEHKLMLQSVDEDIVQHQSLEVTFNELKNLLAVNQQLDKKIKEQSEELVKEKERVSFITEAMPQMVWTADPDGNLDTFNQQWTEYTGLAPDELQNGGWRKTVHHDDSDMSFAAWQKSVATGADYQYEKRLRRADGEYRWHLSRAKAQIGPDGKILIWVGTNTDINDHKLAESKKDEFISIASHELKTPLTSIKAYTQLMHRDGLSTEQRTKFLNKTEHHISRLNSLISDLLDVSKINAGKVNYNINVFEFDDVLRETVESVQHTSPAHQLIIQSSVKGKINGDRLRIEQVINNLLTNAVKYSPKANQVIIRSEIDDDNLIVSVQDFGIGIEPANVSNLFDRYYKVDNTSMKYEGLGLGLFITSEIVKRHNGSLWIESEQGEGSTFYFLLPLAGKKSKTIGYKNAVYIYENQHLKISYNKQEHWLEADWKGFQNFDSVKNGCLVMLHLLKKNNCQKILNDNTRVKGNWSEAVEWVSKQWFPLIEKAGLKHLAWIYSPSLFSQLSTQKSVDAVEGNIVTQLFNDKNEAWLWLKNQ